MSNLELSRVDEYNNSHLQFRLVENPVVAVTRYKDLDGVIPRGILKVLASQVVCWINRRLDLRLTRGFVSPFLRIKSPQARQPRRLAALLNHSPF